MSAYREAGEAPCHQCDRPAREACASCTRLTCAKHLDARRMCGKCDEALYRYMKSDDGALPAPKPELTDHDAERARFEASLDNQMYERDTTKS